jgi:hypothetical protein
MPGRHRPAGHSARASCDDLKNTSGGVTFDLRRLRPEDSERFFSVVLDGKRQMPPWRGAGRSIASQLQMIKMSPA